MMAEERKAVTKKEGTFDKDLIRELAELLEDVVPDLLRGSARPR